MQITNVMIFGGVLILVILLMTMSDNIVPYARSSSTLNEYVYEGMRKMEKRNASKSKSTVDSSGDGARAEAREAIKKNLEYVLNLTWTGGNKQHNINRTKEIRRLLENEDEKINLCDIYNIVNRYKPNSDKLNEVNTVRDLKDDIDTYTRINQIDTNKGVLSIISDIRTVANAKWDFKPDDNNKVSSDILKLLSEENTFSLCDMNDKINNYKTNNPNNISNNDKATMGTLMTLKDKITRRISIAKSKDEGFTNLSDIPVQTIDVFSTSVGSPTCVGKSSGLSNSTGSLCLTDNMTQMLQTRGGNSTGPDSQIGGQ